VAFTDTPNTSVSDFLSELSLTLNKVKNKKQCYVLRDFNIDLTKFNCDSNVSKYLDKFIDFLPFVYLPMRVTQTTATIIDHVFSNDVFNKNDL